MSCTMYCTMYCTMECTMQCTMQCTMEPTQAMAALRQMFGPVPPPKRVIVTRWGEDPFAYGSYSFVGVGATGADYILWHVGSLAPALMATGSTAECCSLHGTL